MNSKNESKMAEVIGQQILPTWLNFHLTVSVFWRGWNFLQRAHCRLGLVSIAQTVLITCSHTESRKPALIIFHALKRAIEDTLLWYTEIQSFFILNIVSIKKRD